MMPTTGFTAGGQAAQTSARYRCRLVEDSAEIALAFLRSAQARGDPPKVKWLAVFSARDGGHLVVEVWCRRPMTSGNVGTLMDGVLGGPGRFENLESFRGAFCQSKPVFEVGQKDRQGMRLVTVNAVCCAV